MPMMPVTILPLPLLLRVLLLSVAIVAAIYDWRFRRIPNWLSLAGLVAGFGAQLYLRGAVGLLAAAEGFGLALLIYMPLYLLRGMGAGDVKLMAALGSIAGPLNWLVLFMVTAVVGGAVGVILSLAYGRLYSTLWNVGQIVKELVLLRAPYKNQPQVDMHHPGALRTPHGVIIGVTAIGLALARLL